MRREVQTEYERAANEKARLAEIDQPKLDPGKDCQRCFGTNYEQRKDEEGYVTAIPCDHQTIPF